MKVLITRLLLILEACNVNQLIRIMGCESSDVVRFNLGPQTAPSRSNEDSLT